MKKENSVETPNGIVLYRNYLNPFNPNTKIKYTIPNVGDANLHPLQTTLKVYDMLGREMATLVNENQQPGNYEVNFDAKKLASGVYLYKLSVGSFAATKKMIILK